MMGGCGRRHWRSPVLNKGEELLLEVEGAAREGGGQLWRQRGVIGRLGVAGVCLSTAKREVNKEEESGPPSTVGKNSHAVSSGSISLLLYTCHAPFICVFHLVLMFNMHDIN